MKKDKAQIFPFYLEEGSVISDNIDFDGNKCVVRSIELVKTTLNSNDWFFSDNTPIDELIFWKNSKVTHGVIEKGIALSKSGISASIQKKNINKKAIAKRVK